MERNILDHVILVFILGTLLSTSCVIALSPCLPPSSIAGRHSIESMSGSLGNIWRDGIPNGAMVRISVRCDQGFITQPSVLTRCSNGTWLTPWPACVAVRNPCTVPNNEPNVQQYVDGAETKETSRYHTGSMLPHGTLLVARCRDPGKYKLIGDRKRHCINGQWSGVNPECEWQHTQVLFYGAFRQVAVNGTVVVYQRPAEHPKRLDVRCYISRAAVRGQAELITTPLDAQYEWKMQQMHTKRLFPTRIEYSGNFTCTTHESGLSHTVNVVFNDVQCDTPLAPANGTLHEPYEEEWRRGRFPIGKKIMFSCNEGYRLVGATKTTCVMGEWSEPSPVCKINRCPEVAIPDNAIMEGVYGYGRNIGDERIFYCKRGFVLQGLTNLIRCMEGGVWSDALPTCERISVTVQQVSPCEFVQCESWEKCVVTGPNSTRCSCINPFKCMTSGPEVCGTDGANYTSECHLKAMSCLLNTGVDIAGDPGICINSLGVQEETSPDQEYEPEDHSQSSSSSFGDPVVNTRNMNNVQASNNETPRSSPSPIEEIPTAEVPNLMVGPGGNVNGTLTDASQAAPFWTPRITTTDEMPVNVSFPDLSIPDSGDN